jgi:hypothetical protein
LTALLAHKWFGKMIMDVKNSLKKGMLTSNKDNERTCYIVYPWIIQMII